MSLLSRLEQYLASLSVMEKGDALILAVSGGLDSMVMLDLFYQLRKKWKFHITVAHINHGLRGAESDADEVFVKEQALALKLSFESARVDVLTLAKTEKRSIQDAARQLRYQALENIRSKHEARWILTAHHVDDNAETMLMHFIRGSGIKGLRGIVPVSGTLLRPMLFASREMLEAYAAQRSIRWREDRSNEKDLYDRNAVRHSLIPLLKEILNPGLSETLSHSSGIFRALNEFIVAHVDRLSKETFRHDNDHLYLAIPTLIDYLDFEKFAVIQRAIETFYTRESAYTEIISIRNLMESMSGKVLHLKKNEYVFRDRDELVFTHRFPEKPSHVRFQTGEDGVLDHRRIRVRAVPKEEVAYTKDTRIEYIDAHSVGSEWILRFWKKGDWFIPLGSEGKQKLSDFFINQKIPRHQKNKVLLLETIHRTPGEESRQIVWICGMRLDARAKIHPRSTSILRLEILEETERHEN